MPTPGTPVDLPSASNLNDRIELLRDISKRLVWSLTVLAAAGIGGAFLTYRRFEIPTPLGVFFVGFVGGFVGLQRRLKSLPAEDLTLLGRSWICIVLSPIAGAILAELVYLLFISGLLEGSLFPTFDRDPAAASGPPGLRTLFAVSCHAPADYAKVLFWSFVAGFSEKFATNIIGQFESRENGAADGRR